MRTYALTRHNRKRVMAPMAPKPLRKTCYKEGLFTCVVVSYADINIWLSSGRKKRIPGNEITFRNRKSSQGKQDYFYVMFISYFEYFVDSVFSNLSYFYCGTTPLCSNMCVVMYCIVSSIFFLFQPFWLYVGPILENIDRCLTSVWAIWQFVFTVCLLLEMACGMALVATCWGGGAFLIGSDFRMSFGP